ncbi:DUF397 domain-containing protein [Streptomyces sp. NPDC059517]|uniref:DUF397 domain-containing protein n=1 Tax=Streptomyces sp. NPDC059517 TaxID=3346855 RepID=UPI0036951760
MTGWRKSSYSGPGDGDSCAEMSDRGTHIAVRDSKAPAHGTLTFPLGVFTLFVEALKLDLPTPAPPPEPPVPAPVLAGPP